MAGKLSKLIEKLLSDPTAARLEGGVTAIKGAAELTDDMLVQIKRVVASRARQLELKAETKVEKTNEKKAIQALCQLGEVWNDSEDLVTQASKHTAYLDERAALPPTVLALLDGKAKPKGASVDDLKAVVAFERKHGGVQGRFPGSILAAVREALGPEPTTTSEAPAKKARKKAAVVSLEGQRQPAEMAAQ